MSRELHSQPPHIIRLRGPWEFTLQSGPRAGETGRIDLSGAWPDQLPSDATALRLTRHFQAPSGISDSTRVHLVLRDFPADVIVSLDGEPLPASNGSYDLTARLQRRHCLHLDLSGIPSPGEVWLEIQETD